MSGYTIDRRREAASMGGQVSARRRRLTRAEGLQWARAWRERNRPYFDAIHGPEETAGD